MSEPTMTDVLVAIGRIEEQLRGLTEKIDRIESQTEARLRELDSAVDQHWKKLGDHEREIALLKERSPRRLPVWTVLSSVVTVATLLILVLDRFYLNQ